MVDRGELCGECTIPPLCGDEVDIQGLSLTAALHVEAGQLPKASGSREAVATCRLGETSVATRGFDDEEIEAVRGFVWRDTC